MTRSSHSRASLEQLDDLIAKLGKQLIVLLCGGHKGSQKRDIAKAVELAKKLEIEP